MGPAAGKDLIKGKANFPEMNKSAFEELLKEVVEFYLKQDDVIDVIDIKLLTDKKILMRLKRENLPIRLTRNAAR